MEVKYSEVPAEIIENRQYLIFPHTPLTSLKHKKCMHYTTFYGLQLNCTSSIMFNFDEGLHNDPFSKGIFK